MTSYRAHATERTLAKLSVLMPEDVFERVRLAAKAQGLTMKELVGRVAFRAGRLLDVELVPFFPQGVPYKEREEQQTERTRT